MATSSNVFRIWNVRVLNVSLVAFVLLYAISLGPTFDAYLLELAKKDGSSDKYANLFVGSVESVQGMTALIAAVPIGIIVDKVNRRWLMRIWSTFFGTVAMLCCVWGILADSKMFIYVGMVLVAILQQVRFPCSSAILADSVPKDKLREVIAWNSSLATTALGVGPLLQMAMILYLGDNWSMSVLHVFCTVGFALWPVIVAMTWLLRPTNKELEQNNLSGAAEALASSQGASGGANGNAAQDTQAPGAPAEANAVDPKDQWKEDKICGIKKKWFVPLLIEFCSLITAVGAGMTVKFFPLFFKEDYHFSPMAFCGLSAASFLGVSLCVMIFSKLATRTGVVKAALLCHVVGTGCLYCLWQAMALPWCIFFFIVRGGIMNAKGPIDSGIIMDCVDTKYRGRWASIQTISRASWAGSAFLGGWLADTHDYRYTFLITAIIYSISAVVYSSLLFIVPQDYGRKDPADTTPASPSAPQDAGAAEADLERVLSRERST